MKRLRVTVEGKSYEVTVEALGEADGSPAPVQAATSVATAAPAADTGGGTPVPSPLAGKVVSISTQVGQTVGEGDEILVLEAMKMNTYVYAPSPGKIASIAVQEGDSIEEGQTLVMLA